MAAQTIRRRSGLKESEVTRPRGHRVSIANSRGPDSLRATAAETGATAVSAEEAAHAGELVIVTIPERAVAKLPRNLFAGVPEARWRSSSACRFRFGRSAGKWYSSVRRGESSAAS